jgi:lysophospholipase L1-like esterase
MKSVNIKYVLAVLIFSVLMVLLATEVILYSRNTLTNHPMWSNGKLLLSAPTMGAGDSTRTRNLLNRNRLNLHAWHGRHGLNEILLNEIFQFGSMRFNLFLGKNSYINIIYNKKADNFSGVRLSTNSNFPSMFFLADPGGQFLQKQYIENLNITNSWHTVELTFQSQDMILKVDGNLVQRIPATALKRQVVGFQSGGYSVFVDNVEVRDHNSKCVIKEDFRNNRHYWLLTITLFGISAGLMCLVFGATKIVGIHLKKTYLMILFVEFCMINFLSMYWAFDYLYYSKKYPYQFSAQPWGAAARDSKFRGFENIRMRCFDVFRYLDTPDQERVEISRKTQLETFLKLNNNDSFPRVYWELQVIKGDTPAEQTKVMKLHEVQKYLNNVPKSFYKILLLGSSQTWGEGALRPSDRMAHQIYRRLRELAGTPDILLVNPSFKGASSPELYKIYKEKLHFMYPDLTVVNLSTNDSSLETFAKSLNDIATFSRKQNAAVMFVQEANNSNFPRSSLAQKHRIMAEVAEKNDIFCLDMHAYLSSDDMVDSGLLWFDFVHLTSYGQKRAGELIAQHIFTILGL